MFVGNIFADFLVFLFLKTLFFRQTDRITIPGVFTEAEDGTKTVQPMTIFTFDVNDPMHGLFEPQFKILEDGRKEQLPILWGSKEVQKQAMELRKSVDERFYKQYNVGINAYIDGDWETAEGAMKLAKGYRPTDGPTNQILVYIRSHQMKPPTTWGTLFHEFNEGY